MNRTWLLFEKIFAVVELLITVLITCILYQTELEKGESIADQGHPNLHLYQIVEYLNVIILLFLFVAGGVLLLFNKRAGWIISVPMWFCFVVAMVFFTLTSTKLHGYEWVQFITCVAIGISFLIFILQKQFLKKYQVSKKDWLIIAGLIAFILIDTCWHRIF